MITNIYVKRKCTRARLAWAQWRSATDDSVSQDAVRHMQLQTTRYAALRVCDLIHIFPEKYAYWMYTLVFN